ncbi:MAG: restriction endonuclease subunit S [Pseudomonadota bacterium]|nr:restriction endonuclease subunit S [Pseudomonadota bacterium]
MASEWNEQCLENCMDAVIDYRGKTPKKTNFGIPLVTAKIIKNGRILPVSEYIAEEDYETWMRRGIPLPGDIVLTTEAPLGEVAQLDDRKIALAQRVITLRGKKGFLDNTFLKYLLMSHEVQHQLDGRGTGTTVKGIKQSELREVTLKFPNFVDQKAIAHVLGTLDDRIELNRRMNETSEGMAQALFKSWFVDFDPVIDNAIASKNVIPDEFFEKGKVKRVNGKIIRPGRDDSSSPFTPNPLPFHSLFPDEFSYSDELGWIPMGWEVSCVGDEFDVTMGQSPPGTTYNETGEGVPFFQGRADFGFRYPSNRIYCTAPKRFAKEGDSLVSVRAPVGDVNMAHVDCCVGREVAAIRHKTGSGSYTYYAMHELREHFNKFEAEGTVFGSINQKDFKALLQLKIDSRLLKHFDTYAGVYDQKIEKNSLAIVTLTTLRDTLLPKLLSGELRIPDAEKMVEGLEV